MTRLKSMILLLLVFLHCCTAQILDCNEVPDGTSVYDLCDVCDGDGLSCIDCNGVPFGTNVYDICGICDGDGSTCTDPPTVSPTKQPTPEPTPSPSASPTVSPTEAPTLSPIVPPRDCNGVAFGTSTYDLCGVCDGDNECMGCIDEHHQPAVIDHCGVCGGHDECLDCEPEHRDVCGRCFGLGDTCVDCAGVSGGSAAYDICGVCGGATECLDCSGAVDGSLAYDVCGVCGGGGTGCDDCDGTPGGTNVVDACGVCGGDSECVDCAGAPNGFASYDACGVCNGDATSCLDCLGVVNGHAAIDACGVCNGSGVPCHHDDLGRALDDHGRPVGDDGLPLDDEVAADVLVLGQNVNHSVFSLGLALGIGAVCVLGCILVACSGLYTRRVRDKAKAKVGSKKKREEAAPTLRLPAPRGSARYRPKLDPVALYLLCIVGTAVSATPLDPSELDFLQSLCADTNVGVAYSSTSWCDFEIHPCTPLTWEGVECFPEADLPLSDTRHLSSLTLLGTGSSTPLTGKVPMGKISQLRLLEVLRINNEPQLEVDFPASIELVQNLKTLILSNVDMSDVAHIPSELGSLAKLMHLDLSQSRLKGSIPTSLVALNQLEILRLRENELDGRAVPPYIDNFGQLRIYDVRANRLNGTLPAAALQRLGDELKLEELLLSNNAISGTLPIQLEHFEHSLGRLEVNANKLEGSIPSELGQLSLLSSLLLGTNCLTGTVPSELGLLSNLLELDVSSNKLEGALPTELLALGSPPMTLALFHSNNFVNPLPIFTLDNFCGLCSFSENLLCSIDPQLLELNCAFGELETDPCGLGCGDHSCLDCNGVVNGTSAYDVCGVCDGDESSCEDCTGVPNGPSAYDACGVCDGDNSTCLDCAGVPNGNGTYDICGACTPLALDACLDCAGVQNGTAVYDICDVCAGDGTSCIDCDGVQFGTKSYDECGVCGGDGSSCLRGMEKQEKHEDAKEWNRLSVWIVLALVSTCVCVLVGLNIRLRTRRRVQR